MLEFDWDENKRQKNIEKHGIDFFDAIKIFWGTILQKISPKKGEQRFLAIGKIGGDFLAVVYVKRGNTIRIISARKAKKYERRAYQSKYPHFS